MPDMQEHRVKKRAPTACVRCRKQKIRCSGSAPCVQCSRRSHQCVFDNRQSKVLVTHSYLLELERRASGNVQDITNDDQAQLEPRPRDQYDGDGNETALVRQQDGFDEDRQLQYDAAVCMQTQPPEAVMTEHDLQTGHQDDRDATSPPPGDDRITPEPHLTNPLDPSASEPFIVNHHSRRFFLGVSSNWSFGRRVLSIVHERVHGSPPAVDTLLFEGQTYDLGWSGQRSFNVVDTSIVPAPDFALFLINAVKFHCGQLFHLFDEATLMHSFSKFYDNRDAVAEHSRSWYIQFLLILALGKAFILQAAKTKRSSPGTELFTQAIQLLPNITTAWEDPLQSMEIYCAIALFYHCLDLRSAAYNVIGQASRIASEQGLHTDMQSQYLSGMVVERCRAIWWTIYVLDRQMTALLGVPVSLSDDDISTPLPRFEGSSRKATALSLQVKLAKATAVILQTVYRRSSGQNERFLNSMKNALRTIGQANEERNECFPLDPKRTSTSVCRLSAYLHLLHHQALMLATRPLLYSFLQKRLVSVKSIRVSASRGARSLIRVCVSSAQQCLAILEALQSQSLLECFLPFDREAAFSAGLVYIIAHLVDNSLVRDRQDVNIAFSVLEEMSNRGNLLADLQKRELEQVDLMVSNLESMAQESATDSQALVISPEFTVPDGRPTSSSAAFDGLADVLGEWNSEDELSGERLLLMADSLDLDSLHWFMTESFE